jgi:hypothetical protein
MRSATAAGDSQTIYTINGRTLTISSTDPIVLQSVRGAHLFVTCESARRGANGFGRWGKQASSVTIHLRGHDISKDVGECEAMGALRGFSYNSEFSRVGFTATWRKRFASTPPPGRLFAKDELYGVWLAVHQFLPARFLNLHGIVVSLPPPRVLVRIMNRALSKSAVRLIYVPTPAGVTKPGVPAVIGHGSSRTRLELAVRGLDGTLYVFRGKVGSYLRGTFGAVH